jgi:hypothetical protein
LKNFISLFFLFFILDFNSQIVKGKIKDIDGNEIPFCKVREINSSYGTVANSFGIFQLELKKGQHILSFSSIGFETFIDTIEVKENISDLNIILKPAIQELDEMTIMFRSKKDRGKEIMKQAIEKRSFFKDLLSEYSCDTYTLSSLEKDKMDSIQKDSIIGKEKLNLTEWKAITSFKSPNRFKDEFYAYNDFSDKYKNLNSTSVGFSIDIGSESLVPGSNQTSNPYLLASGIKDIHFSIFDNVINAPKIAQNPIISPLAFNALLFYNFYLENSFIDKDSSFVYEIKVEPKFSYEALFEGTIYIRDEKWEVVSYELGVNPKVLLYYKEIRIICDYEKLENRLVPTRREFIYNIKEGKTNINALIRVLHTDYVFNVEETSKKFWLEASVYKEDAFDKDSTFWNEKRPFILKDFEKQFIKEQDSLISYYESEEYLKKNDSIRNRITFLNILFNGIGHVNSFKKSEFTINPIVNQVIPFGVGGYRHRLDISYKKEFENGKIITINPNIDYGFLNKDIKGSFGGSFMYNPLHFSKLGFEIGDIYDFVTGNQNIQGFLAPANRVRNKKVSINFRRELINGLYINSNLLFSDRKSIDSLKYPSWASLFGNFQTPQSFDPYRILLASFDFEYHFRQKYSIRKNKKIIIGSPWPVINLRYKKSLPNFFQSDADFDFVELKISDEIKLNSFGNAELRFLAGSFLRKKDLRIIEHTFFRPSDRYFFSNPTHSLQLLDTALNTSNSYIQFNYIHHFNGFFLNKIWLLNKLKLEETIGGNFLVIPDANFAQAELYLGLERKFRVRKELFKIGVYAVTQDNSFGKASLNFKFGFNMYNSFKNRWDY